LRIKEILINIKEMARKGECSFYLLRKEEKGR
jgi:hypothetical protein